jgi:hypothetical protein
MMGKQRRVHASKATENFQRGFGLAATHPLFGALLGHISVVRRDDTPYPREGWAKVRSDGTVYAHPHRLAEPEEWMYVLAHCALHLGFGHFQLRFRQREWELACECVVWQFLSTLKLGRPPETLRSLAPLGSPELPARTEEDLYRYFCAHGLPDLPPYGVTGTTFTDMIEPPAAGPDEKRRTRWDEVLAEGLAYAVACAVDVAGGVEVLPDGRRRRYTPAQRARSWLISSYPLLGSLAAAFEVIEDPKLCARIEVSIAAVSDYTKEIYVNPAAGLTEDECRFVMAHELLHVALRHSARGRGRDAVLWNVACDFVINEWLSELRVGALPRRPESTWTRSIATAWRRDCFVTANRAGACCRPPWLRRSGRSANHRFLGMCNWPAGLTTSSRRWRRFVPMRARAGARAARPIFPGLVSCLRPIPQTAARSAWCWILPAR